MSDEKYNGHANRQTWTVWLWIDNDQGDQELVMELVKDVFESAGGVGQVADALKDFIEGMHNDILSSASMAADLLGHALAWVEWYELADSYQQQWLEENYPGKDWYHAYLEYTGDEDGETDA